MLERPERLFLALSSPFVVREISAQWVAAESGRGSICVPALQCPK